jgi:hypothetical protein
LDKTNQGYRDENGFSFLFKEKSWVTVREGLMRGKEWSWRGWRRR